MLTIISGTNRHGSNTEKVAREYQLILLERGVDTGFMSLEGIDLMRRDEAFIRIEEEVLIPTSHFIFVSPEYNGSFPGVLKLLFDTSRSQEIWFYKKALLAGVASGRAGNLRGMDHLADILNYLKITVHPNRLPISSIDKMLTPEGRITDAGTLKSIHLQLDEFIAWM